MEETISLKEVFAVLRKRLSMILLITIIATATSGIISFFFITPIYQSSTQLLVNQSKSENQIIDPNQIKSNLELINTYNVIMKSPAILEKVIDELDLNKTASQLNSQISVSAVNNSQVISVTVEDPDSAKAAKIANTVAAVFQKEIATIMNVDNVSILSPAELVSNPSPVKPNPVLNMAIAFVVGLMIGVGLAFLLEYLDNTVKTEQDLEKLLGLPVLGAVGEINVGEGASAPGRSRKQKLGSESLES
ncbi:YveK family protein [Bacillus taeanensis]|uniref:Capsular biosynthesis protein n=1 Tax=Bacillus taeanensis TaxID=273032 RepID=A0A366XUS2_9BACI|nr:Wzz/FepE/Etk N-terminal domain-containing protein [Bacillus taeanensis]RBW68895.1 capsular biosynthesis protein [Bacillus taeanensis]